jgi:probable HAF family extracellular repeat protein
MSLGRRVVSRLSLVAVVCIVLLSTAVSASVPIRDLRTPGGAYSTGYAINDRGEVAGYGQMASGEYHAFFWKAGRFLDLGTLGGTFSIAMDMNDRSDVAGYGDTASGALHAFLWKRGRGMMDLGGMPGGGDSIAQAVNNADQIAGWGVVGFQDGFPITHAFRWSNGQFLDLGTLGGRDSFALGINDFGWVVGSSDASPDYPNGGGPNHAFLWTPRDGMRDLGALGPGGAGGYAVSRSGFVVGTTSTQILFPGGGCCEVHAFRWTAAEGMVDLGTLGGRFSGARDVTESGEVIGNFETGARDPYGAPLTHAFLWRNGVMMDLGTLGTGDQNSYGEAINDFGEVVGGSATADGLEFHAVVWSTGDN